MVTRNCLSVTLYVNCVPCLKLLFHCVKYNTYTYVIKRAMPFCLVSALTISQIRLTVALSLGVKPVSGSGTSRTGFVSSSSKELDRFPMSDITGRLLESAEVKGEVVLYWSARDYSLVQLRRSIPCSNPLQKNACE